MSNRLPSENSILQFLHCKLCLEEKPDDISPKDWQRIQVGWTRPGLQVWCTRHECNIVHIDFEGEMHPANILTSETENALT